MEEYNRRMEESLACRLMLHCLRTQWRITFWGRQCKCYSGSKLGW